MRLQAENKVCACLEGGGKGGGGETALVYVRQDVEAVSTRLKAENKLCAPGGRGRRRSRGVLHRTIRAHCTDWKGTCVSWGRGEAPNARIPMLPLVPLPTALGC